MIQKTRLPVRLQLEDEGLAFLPAHVECAEIKYDNQHVILKLTPDGRFIRLRDRQFFVWCRLDGAHSLKEIIKEFHEEYGEEADDWIFRFIKNLAERGLLFGTEEISSDVASSTALRRWEILERLRKFIITLCNINFHISHGAYFVQLLYKRFFWIFYTKIGLCAVGFVLLAPLILIEPHVYEYKVSLLTSGFVQIGPIRAPRLCITYLIFLVTVVVHEFGHALTVCHFKRSISGFGISLRYLLFLTIYVNVTDMWIANRNERILVSAAGPIASSFMGSLMLLLSTVLTFLELDRNWAAYWYSAGIAMWLLSLINLYPFFLKLDGYFMLMDWIGIPSLRTKSFRYLKREPWAVFHWAQLSHEKRWLITYGIMTLLTIFLIVGRFLYRLTQ